MCGPLALRQYDSHSCSDRLERWRTSVEASTHRSVEHSKSVSYTLGMGLWSRMFRITAMLLVLYVGVEMLTCELPGSDCSVLSALSKHPPVNSGTDNCICCCAHSIVTPQVFQAFTAIETAPFEEAAILAPLTRSYDIEHPPQNS